MSRPDPDEEDIARYAAERMPSDESVKEQLAHIAKEARVYWDQKGEGYPPHLRSLMAYLGQPYEESPGD
jgi:hypothetical protein